MELIETAPHEFAAHFLFIEHGLAPFFTCYHRIKEGDGSQEATFEFAGERWEVTLSYRDSGLAHPGALLPTGTKFQLDSMRVHIGVDRFVVRRSLQPVEEPDGVIVAVGEQHQRAGVIMVVHRDDVRVPDVGITFSIL